MEVILNDHSINGQFSDEDFIEYMVKDVLPIMELLSEYSMELLKSYDVYTKMVTDRHSLGDYLHKRGNPVIDRFKYHLSALAYREPFWQSSPATDQSKIYICDILEVPNCITEVYERNGALFSFKEGGFDLTEIMIQCNNKPEKVSNFNNLLSAKEWLEDIGVIEIWKTNSFFVNGLGYRFEIRFNEGHHNIAHFHLSNADENASLSIPDADILEGNLKNEKKAVSWSLQNMSKIIELWNKYHPEKMVKVTYK